VCDDVVVPLGDYRIIREAENAMRKNPGRRVGFFISYEKHLRAGASRLLLEHIPFDFFIYCHQNGI
jgi:hypothetical protein